MTCAIDNAAGIELSPDPSLFITAITGAGLSDKKKVATSPFVASKQRPVATTVNVKPEDFIAFQMSIVPEVEQVYVSANRGELHVVIVVNDRDRILNRKIFARENAIVDYYRHLRFDFHIVPRMNRNLSDIMAIHGTRVL